MPNQYVNTSMSTFNQSEPILWGLLKLGKGAGLGVQDSGAPLALESGGPGAKLLYRFRT